MRSLASRRLPSLVLVLPLALTACARTEKPPAGADADPDADVPSGTPDAAPVAEPFEISILAPGTRVSGVPGDPAFQNVAATADLPRGSYQSLRLLYRLTATCDGAPPPGQNWPADCDPFDRISHVTLADEGATPLLLGDVMTPFGGDGTYEVDVTDYYPALVGTHAYRVHISSGADPAGAVSGTNAGWNVELTLIAEPGPPPREVVAVEPLFYALRHMPADGVIARSFTAPDAGAARLDFFTTGHGGVGNPPCDEFCEKTNTVALDRVVVWSEAPWTDCAGSCTQEPAGTSFSCLGQTFDYVCQENPTACPPSATFDRAGWCPGRQVERRSVDLPGAGSGTHELRFAVADSEGFFAAAGAVVFTR